ncbi:hypothetical protein FQZ97_1130980 [compost metagenome]
MVSEHRVLLRWHRELHHAVGQRRTVRHTDAGDVVQLAGRRLAADAIGDTGFETREDLTLARQEALPEQAEAVVGRRADVLHADHAEGR